nr:protein of unknown function (DUF1876) [uncultured bacterium]
MLFKLDFASRLGKRGFETVDVTTAMILEDDLQVSALGYSIRAEEDEVDDVKGAELALARALKKLTLDKALREKFWDAFFHAVNWADIRKSNIVPFPVSA